MHAYIISIIYSIKMNLFAVFIFYVGSLLNVFHYILYSQSVYNYYYIINVRYLKLIEDAYFVLFHM